MSLAGAVLAFLMEGRRPALPTPATVALLGFTVVFLMSSLFAERASESVNDIKLFANWLLVIVLITGTVTTERRWFLFLVLFLLFSLKMSQHGFRSWVTRGFAFTGWGVTGGPGWFQNSGEFALQMGIFVPLSTYLYLAIRPQLSRLKRLLMLMLPISGVASIIASSSRGGLLALAAVAIWAALRSRYRFRASFALVVVAPLIWLIVPAEMKARFTTAGTDATSLSRLTYWKYGMEMAKDHPVLGVGVGNWESYYRAHYFVAGDTLNRFDETGKVKIEVAHNSFVEVGSQMGYAGLLAFVSVLISIFIINRRTRVLLERLSDRGRLLSLSARALDDGVVAFCIAGFFMSVALYPFVWFQLAMSAGVHAAARNLVQSARKAQATHPAPDRLSMQRRPGRVRAPRWRGTAAASVPFVSDIQADHGAQ
ncbi:O-antigen ligase family protein [Gemmatimonas sp.]|uniref:O-antigen ligase family protein n=1 Tax=Gemmatimonas sp. TaxID=1962908 RepID=UPI002EDB6A4F